MLDGKEENSEKRQCPKKTGVENEKKNRRSNISHCGHKAASGGKCGWVFGIVLVQEGRDDFHPVLRFDAVLLRGGSVFR